MDLTAPSENTSIRTLNKLRKGVAFLLLLLVSIPGKGQATSTFYVKVQAKPLNFSYVTAADYENKKEILNAIQIALRANGQLYHLYVRVARSGGTGTSQMPGNLFYVLYYNSAPNRNLPKTPFYLSTTDQLFTQQLNPGTEERYEFHFGINPLNYMYKAGSYTHDIIWTLTGP